VNLSSIKRTCEESHSQSSSYSIVFLISARIVSHCLIALGRQKSVKALFCAFEITVAYARKLSVYAGLGHFVRCMVEKYNTIFY